MTITAADLVFFRAEQPTDLPTGGGRRTSIAVEGGAENNLFPDVAPAVRAAGGVQMRKFYPSVVSEDADVLMSAQVRLASGPADTALDMVLFAFGDQQTTRAQAQAHLQSRSFTEGTVAAYNDTADPFVKSFPFSPYWRAGDRAGFYTSQSGQLTLTGLAVATAVDSSSGNDAVTFSGKPPAGLPSENRISQIRPASRPPAGVATLAAPAAAGSSSVSLNRVLARVVPNITPYPSSVTGIDPAWLKVAGGLLPIYRAGDPVLIAGGGVSEVVVVAFVDYRGGLEFSAPLVNAYPTGATVSSLLDLGDLGASVGASFSQQTWTKTFSDSLIGQPIGANFDRSHAITTTNIGAITERWAIVFTGATAYKLIGERVGQVATGTTDAAFAPVNPLTNRPYFTIPPAGWGGGWATGNVLRFNTAGAYAPVWAVRTVSPSAPGGLDGSVIEMRGGVNA